MENTTDAETIMETGRDNPIVENAGADGVGAVDAAVAAVAADTRHPPAHPAAEQRHTPLPDSRRGPGRPSIAAGDTGCMPPSGPQQEPQPARKHPAGPTRSRPKGPVNGVRKFIIESTFGLPRVRGSRKSRPCDVCRHRKIACVIATEPPCDFCRSRDLECTGVLGLKYGLNIDSGVPLHGSELATAPEALPQHRLVDVCDGLSVKPSVKPPENVAAKPPPRQTVETTVMPPTSPADDETEVHLDNCEGQSIYYIGPGAEQDSLLLDSFRYPILNDCPLARCKIVPVHPGGESSTDRPVNFLLLNRTQSEAASLSKKNSLEVIEGNAFPYGPILVRLYFAHIHPAFPILPKSRFLRSYSTDRESIPSSLRGAVYAVASTFWAHDKSLPGRCPIQQHAMLDLAHSALRREIESPSLFIVAACLLIIHGTSGKAENIETPATWTLAAQATAAAQMIGLHQDPGRWKIPSDEKRLRRKLWWACYATDCFSSMAFGNPPHIGAGGWSTLEPSLEDLRCDEDVPSNLEHLIEGENTRFDVTTGARFLELVKISKYMREILDSNFQTNMYPKGYVAPNESQRASGLMEMQRQLKNWEILGPSCLVLRRSLSVASKPSFNGPFHMALLATKTLLYRALMQPATEPKAVIGSHLRTLLLEAIEDFDSLPQYLGEMSEHDLNGFWGRHARSQLVSCINFIIFLNLGAVEAGDKKLSRELLDRLACSMRRLQPLASAEARLFLAPAMMRLKSFTSNYYRRGSLEKVTPAVSIPDDDEIDMKMGEERRAEAEASVISIESGTDGDNAKLSEQN